MFIGAILYMIHSIGPVNVCTNFEINRYKIDEVRKYAKIVFYLTSRDAKTVRRTSWGLDTYDRYFDQEHCEINPKSLRLPVQIVVFMFSVTLTLTFDLRYIFCHTHCAWCTRIPMRSFIRIRPVLMGDMPSQTPYGRYAVANSLCFIMGYLVAMEIRVTLFLLVQLLYDT